MNSVFFYLLTDSIQTCRTPHGNDSCMSVVPPNSCMSTLGAPVARVQITPPAAPQSPGRSIVVTQSVTLAQKQTPGSIFTVSAGQLPLSNLPTGIAKSKIHLQVRISFFSPTIFDRKPIPFFQIESVKPHFG